MGWNLHVVELDPFFIESKIRLKPESSFVIETKT